MKKLDKAHFVPLFGYCIALGIAVVLLKDLYRLILFSNRGLDLTDEAFYALSYSTRDEVGRSFTGATWIIGALYDLVGHDLARLRVLKSLVLVATGGFLGWQTFEWIYSYQHQRFSYAVRELRGYKIALILGASLVTLAPYCWTPATPSYNDLNLVLLLLIASFSLSLLRKREPELSTKMLMVRFGVIGALLGAESFAKWSSAAAAFLLVVPIVLFHFTALKKLVRVAIGLIVGFIAFWIFTWLFLANIFHVVPRSLNLLTTITQDGYDPATMIKGYTKQIIEVVKLLIREQKLLVALCLILPIVLTKIHRYAAIALGSSFAILVAYITADPKYLTGGPAAVVAYGRMFIFVLLMYSTILFIGHVIGTLFTTRPSPSHIVKASRQFVVDTIHLPTYLHNHPIICALWMLILLPFVQALGTLNDILTGATFSNVSWLIVCIVLATWFSTTLFVRYAIVGIAIFGVLGMHVRIIDGYINKPYRLLASPEKMHSQAKGLDAINELRFDRPTAEYLTELQRLTKKAGAKDRSTYIGVWDVPGEIYALNGVSPGEPWYIGGSDRRNTQNIKYSCEEGQLDKKNPPIILRTLTPPESFTEALSDCGIDFPQDYKKVGGVTSPYTLREVEVFAPKR